MENLMSTKPRPAFRKPNLSTQTPAVQHREPVVQHQEPDLMTRTPDNETPAPEVIEEVASHADTVFPDEQHAVDVEALWKAFHRLEALASRAVDPGKEPERLLKEAFRRELPGILRTMQRALEGEA
jgi:hypothetical protein